MKESKEEKKGRKEKKKEVCASIINNNGNIRDQCRGTSVGTLVDYCNIPFPVTVAITFFLSTETHAKRLLTIRKRSVWTTLKRSFAVLANQIIVSETFQAFRILANQNSVRKTLSWKPCLVANILSFASLVNQNPADSIYLRSFFFYFLQFHLIIIFIKWIKIIAK